MHSTTISRHFNLWSAVAVLVSVIGIGLSHTAHAAERGGTAPAKQISRAEVIADLRLWLRAGLDQYTDLAMRNAAPARYKQTLGEYEFCIRDLPSRKKWPAPAANLAIRRQ